MNVLVFTNLFPNKLEPTRGMYNYQQVVALKALCNVTVVAPVPWAPPLPLSRFRKVRSIPSYEKIGDIEVFHPRYVTIPKMGRALYGILMAISLMVFIRSLSHRISCSLVYVPWVYPDGVAAAIISRMIGLPVVVAALGSDINISTKYLLRKWQISLVLNRAKAVIAVSKALKTRMVGIGVKESNITVVPNGVDTNVFVPMDKDYCRNMLQIPHDRKIILYVGNLAPVKGLNYLISAMHEVLKLVPGVYLYIVGDGNLKQDLQQMARSNGIEGHVIFAGIQPHDSIPQWLNASDVVCLPSINEGMPNILLEAFACKRYVVATNVGGIPEIVEAISNDQYALVEPCQADQLSSALSKSFIHRADEPENEVHHSIFAWNDNADMCWKIFLKATLQDHAQ